MYEDKEVIIEQDGDVFKGIVLLMEEDVGCSIVKKDAGDNYILCLRGPLSPQWREFAFFNDKNLKKSIAAFNKMMYYVSECIENEEAINIEYLVDISYKTMKSLPNTNATEKTCAFH